MSQIPFSTGSAAQTFSVTAALDALGVDERFQTLVVRPGVRALPRDLHGAVMRVASGDRTLGDRTQADGTLDSPACDHGDAYAVPGLATLTPAHPLAGLDALARQVAAAGVMRGRGDVILDDRLGEPCHVGPRPLTPIVSTII